MQIAEKAIISTGVESPQKRTPVQAAARTPAANGSANPAISLSTFI